MPANSTVRIAIIAPSARCAAATAGLRNAGTLLLTASTLVIAVHPLANARTRVLSPATPTALLGCGGPTTGVGCPPDDNAAHTPIVSITKRVPTNKHVGNMNRTPASRIPLDLQS